MAFHLWRFLPLVTAGEDPDRPEMEQELRKTVDIVVVPARGKGQQLGQKRPNELAALRQMHMACLKEGRHRFEPLGLRKSLGFDSAEVPDALLSETVSQANPGSDRFEKDEIRIILRVEATDPGQQGGEIELRPLGIDQIGVIADEPEDKAGIVVAAIFGEGGIDRQHDEVERRRIVEPRKSVEIDKTRALDLRFLKILRGEIGASHLRLLLLEIVRREAWLQQIANFEQMGPFFGKTERPGFLSNRRNGQNLPSAYFLEPGGKIEDVKALHDDDDGTVRRDC